MLEKNTQPITLVAHPYVMGTRTPHPFNFRFGDGARALLSDDQAPRAVRAEFNDVEVRFIEDADDPHEQQSSSGGGVFFLYAGDQMTRTLIQNIRLAEIVSEARIKGRTPIAFLGCCSASLGMIGGIGDARGRVGMIWFDCHTDAHTPETSPNGFFDGMPVAVIAGQCWKSYRRKVPGFVEIPEDRILSVGLQSLFDGSPISLGGSAAQRTVGMLVHKPKIEALGFHGALVEALDELRGRCDQVYVHIDADVLDTSILSASSLISSGGLTPSEVGFSLEQIAKRFEILAVAFSAFDPHADPRGCDVLVPLVKQAAVAAANSKQPR